MRRTALQARWISLQVVLLRITRRFPHFVAYGLQFPFATAKPSLITAPSPITSAGYSYPTSPNNNRQIASIADAVDNGRSVSYTYDALNRLTAAATSGSTSYPKWHLTWAYDRFGNRLNQTVQSDTSLNLQPPPPSNLLSFANPGGAQTNRPDNMCFDASGNLMTETSVSPCPPSAPTYTYDAENKLVNYVSATPMYVYDGNGLRVKKMPPKLHQPHFINSLCFLRPQGDH